MEDLILSNLLYNEEYGRKIFPFLKDVYFHDNHEKRVFNLISSYVEKYKNFPTKEALSVDLSNLTEINEEDFKKTKSLIESLSHDPKTELTWLVDKTEQFVKDKAIYNSIMASIKILDDKSGDSNRNSIPKLLSDALSVSFDTNIGHDFLDNFKERFDFYHKKEYKVPFDLEMCNKATDGGVPSKTLNIVMGPVHAGKTLVLCHLASSYLAQGKNVLYITLEMSDMEISRRIDSNLLNVEMKSLKELDFDKYEEKIGKLRNKTQGKLIVKEFPPATVSSAHFRHLINELRIKKNFIPDVIMVDYVNLCVSSRFKKVTDLYSSIKSVCEELRGLAVEFDTRIWTATQLNRDGMKSSDPDMTNTAESVGLPATADLLWVIIINDVLKSLNQIMLKQLKNRYEDLNKFERFVVGIDRSKMRLYTCEQSAQEDVHKDEPVMDKTTFGKKLRDFGDFQ